jgi:hypothetical protein
MRLIDSILSIIILKRKNYLIKTIIIFLQMLSNKKEKEEDWTEDKGKCLKRRKLITKDKRQKPPEEYQLIWSLISKSIPVKHLLILPGDCIFPLSSMSMQNLVEDLYIKSSSIKADGNLELTLSRKIRPFRDLDQLVPLMERIHSPWIPKIKKLLLVDYR